MQPKSNQASANSFKYSVARFIAGTMVIMLIGSGLWLVASKTINQASPAPSYAARAILAMADANAVPKGIIEIARAHPTSLANHHFAQAVRTTVIACKRMADAADIALSDLKMPGCSVALEEAPKLEI